MHIFHCNIGHLLLSVPPPQFSPVACNVYYFSSFSFVLISNMGDMRVNSKYSL